MNATTGNLTQGSITKKLLVFAVPFLVANFIQAMYGAVDMAIVGWFSNAAGISAVSTSSQVIQIVNSMVSGLTMGGTILIAQYIGAGRQKDAQQTIATMLTLSAFAAVAFTTILVALAGPILTAMKTPQAAFQYAMEYLIITGCGIIFTFGYNAISAILRGLGDSASPLIFIGVACVANIVLDLLFVGGFHMGPAGAALATSLSQAVSMLLAIRFLSRRDFIFDFKLKSFRVHKDKALGLLRVGLPVSLQESMVGLSFLFINTIVNSMGVVASAAVGVCGKFESFAMLPPSALSGAIASMAAQNMGAGQPQRAKKCMSLGILFSFLCSLAFFAWAQLAPETIFQLFRAEPEVAAAGAQYIRSFSIDFIMVSFVFCMNGFFNGCGSTTFSMVNGVASTMLFRVPAAYIFSRLMPQSLVGVGLAAPIASFVSIVAGFIYLKTDRWQKNSVAHR